ncbi:DNA-binding SARP family transcriptional activator [Streptosporangium album]|uniref:DNA-binding SARP family transcriptional activator n=1 Tax=Streptosporangium album TaxID=47479 RepID=A0A7W7RS33_9ACTN|nr:AfsR/SARP family transcriptional regulator [Streptosporangium album]MBB4936862.1 DNA-binding SARP family transcriptional activator [Streptosporangium album]
MEFRIMGALEVRDGAENRTPTAPKHRDLLAMFVLNARRPLTVGRLRKLLWPREDGERSDSLVRGYIGQLRQLIGKDVITTVSGTYTLAIEEEQLDVDRFRRLVARGSREDLQEALALWRGPALEDVDPDAGRWVETGRLREELQELHLLALERRVGYELDAGLHREVLAELRRLVAQHPLWQRFHGQYMLALYRSGRRVDALNAYSALRDELDEGHAVEPDAELQLLYHRMLHDDVSLHVSAGPPVLLPRDVADFTGRQDLLDQVIGDQVVVHGAAGVGKSALAVHAAWQQRERFPDGILYADLRETTAPAAVLEDFLRWLGCPAQAVPATLDRRERLLRTYAANRRLLVLLDNAADEGQVRPLLTACPTVVTSRSTLGGLTGATRVPVGVLDDDDASDLVSRLIGPGRAAQAATARLVRLCGGLPIALRIAGSRLAARPAWTVDYLVGLLADEHGRLDRLHAGDQAVRGVLRLGYDGLPEPARRTLRRLGTLSAPDFADWVAAVFGGHAEALVEAGLLETHVIDVAGQVRYRLHDLTRLFAREQLDADAAHEALSDLLAVAMTRVQASRFTLVSGGPASPPAATTDIRQSVEWLHAERVFLVNLVDDLHGAGLWEESWRLAHLLTPFLERQRFLQDWRRTCETGLEAARRTGSARGVALLLRDQGDLHRAERQWDLAHDRLRLALSAFLREGTARDVAHTRRRIGQVHLEQGRLNEAEINLVKCLAAFENTKDIAETLCVLGSVAHRAGRFTEAAERLCDAAARLADLGERHRHADVLLELTAVRLAQGLVPDARQVAQQARGIAVRLGDRLLDARGLLMLARVNLAEGATERARDLAGEALKIFDEAGDDQGRGEALEVLRGT